MGKLLVVVLSAVVIAELLVVIGVAAVLFWSGSAAPIAVGAAMLVVALVAGLVALRAMRPRR